MGTRIELCLVLMSGVDGEVDYVGEAAKLALSVMQSTRGAHYLHLPNKKINARLSVHIGEFNAGFQVNYIIYALFNEIDF